MRELMLTICQRILLLSTCFLILSVFVPAAAAQQSATATLSGRIVDPNQAVVAGAQVTALQRATGTARSATTNADGVFVMTNLPADEFEVKIQAPGFGTRTMVVTLQVGQSETLNATLSVGAVAVNSERGLQRSAGGD